MDMYTFYIFSCHTQMRWVYWADTGQIHTEGAGTTMALQVSQVRRLSSPSQRQVL